MAELTEELKNELLSDKEARHAYFNELLNIYIATQLKVLREQQKLTQEGLAEKSKGFKWSEKDEKPLKQERISAMENVNYASWSISSLRKLAWALDLRLKVSFEEFGTGLREMNHFGRESLQRRPINEDPYFKVSSVTAGDEVEIKGQILKGYFGMSSSNLSTATDFTSDIALSDSTSDIPLLVANNS